jgi:hypothetical protein
MPEVQDLDGKYDSHSLELVFSRAVENTDG